jgi:SecD/SecF fusion protein
MKNKGLVIFIAVVLALTCVYQLSFTYAARKFETKARTFATKGGKFDGEIYRNYIDSLGSKDILNLGIAKRNYFKCKDSELKLGLDLQGGMNVILEVSKGDVIKTLAGINGKQQDVLDAIKMTETSYKSSGGDFVEMFASNYKTKAPNRTLASVFVNSLNKQITSSSTEDQVIDYLKRELQSKADNTRQVIEARLNQGNISQPNIQELEGGRISVELPGVDNPKRIRTLLEQSAKLEFWEVYSNTPNNQFEAYNKIYTSMSSVLAQKNRLQKGFTKDSARMSAIEAIADSTARDSANKAYDAEIAASDSSGAALATVGLVPYTQGQNIAEGPVLGIAERTSINKVNKILKDEDILKALPRNIRFAWGAEPIFESEGKEIYAVYALKATREGNAQLGSGEENIISDAFATTSSTSGRVEVNMSMSNQASREWKKITTNNVGQFIAIVLDNKVFSAPQVNDPISGGNSSISGSFSVEEAQDLANVLKAGKLPAPAQIVAEDVVGPTLGAESVRQGLNSFIIGLIAVIFIMIFYYNRAGVIAVAAVLLNIFFIIGILASYGAALTLPGIAGIVLTLGMAVDANVLIYERIREELREGKVLKSAVSNGFKAALSSIVDGNITTLLAGIIMTFVGAGPVYGFAITLIIGIISSLFTAILISRILIERRLEKDKDVSFSNSITKNLFVDTAYNFIGNRKKFYIISSIIIVVGMSTLIMKGGLSTGIDFKGGYGYQMQLEPGHSGEELKEALNKGLPGSSNEVKTIGSDGRYKIVTTYRINENNVSSDSVEADVIKALSAYNASSDKVLSSSEVGPTIASNIRTKSAWVVLISVIVIFIYIVIRFKKVSFAMGATVALVHDVLMVFSIFALLEGIVPFAIEIDQAFIAAILTVIGYSINDSVVVFDRIREYMANYKSESNIGKLINDAINQTLSRTIMTSGTTLLVISCLFIFGGAALKGFSLALLIGIGIGTYSSVCIAAPVVVDMMKKKKD